MPQSQNGFSANNRNRVTSRKVPGTNRNVTLRIGAPGYLLLDFAAWFDKHIESVDGGTYDDWGYAERPIRGSTTTLSNHASGTALDLNATKHPLGKRNTFSKAKRRKIRRRLKKYDGCIRWGGDYSGRPDEMHFEINRNLAACKKVRDRLKKKTKKAKRRGPVISKRNARAPFVAYKRGEPVQHRGAVVKIQRRLNTVYRTGLVKDGYVGKKTFAAYQMHERKSGVKNTNTNGLPGPKGLRELFKGTKRKVLK